MKRFLPLAPAALLALLLVSPTAALDGGRAGLDLWWSSVFPALLPCFICLRWTQKLGLLESAARHPKGQLLLILGFSLLSGAPNGARLLSDAVAADRLSKREGAALLPLVNGVSPAFLATIIASGLLKNKSLFLPLAVAFYGWVLALLLPFLLCCRPSQPAAFPGARAVSFAEALSASIFEGMLDILKVGGCIVFACTLLSVLRPLAGGALSFALLSALLEVSSGVSAIAALALPLRLQISLLAGAAGFGGLSLALQAACCYPDMGLIPYLAQKLLLGMLIGASCYLLLPLFPQVSAAFASRQAVLFRSLALLSLVLSSLLALLFTFLLSLMSWRVGGPWP